MVDLCPIFKLWSESRTDETCSWSKMLGIWMVRQVTWPYHLNTGHPYCCSIQMNPVFSIQMVTVPKYRPPNATDIQKHFQTVETLKKPDLSSSSDSTSNDLKVTSCILRIWQTALENPHLGASGKPFMNTTTSPELMHPSILFFSSWGKLFELKKFQSSTIAIHAIVP